MKKAITKGAGVSIDSIHIDDAHCRRFGNRLIGKTGVVMDSPIIYYPNDLPYISAAIDLDDPPEGCVPGFLFYKVKVHVLQEEADNGQIRER